MESIRGNVMRTWMLAAGGILAVATVNSASAADLPIPTKELPPPVQVFNWTGFYIGGNFGGGWANQSSTGTQTTPFGPTTLGGSANASGVLGGGQIGYNYEFPNRWVIGIEADGDWASITGSTSGCSTFSGGLFTGFVAGCATNNQKLVDFGTVRGRIGYAWNNVLLYGTGGWAWGNSTGTSTTTCLAGIGAPCPGVGVPFLGGASSFSNSLSGWTAGAGVEWGFLSNWTVRVEYLHLEFDNVGTSFSTTATTALGTGTSRNNISSNNGVDVVRVGLNYLFNFGSAPLVARY